MSEKVRISDVRAATLVDFTYVLLLIYKLFISTVPLSTTWVFLGIIGGREIAVSLARNKLGNRHKKLSPQNDRQRCRFGFDWLDYFCHP